MIKEYRKTATIKAEKFDGSLKQLQKYNINPIRHITANNYTSYDAYRIPTTEGLMDVEIGEYIATGINGEHWAIKPDVFEKTYEEV